MVTSAVAPWAAQPWAGFHWWFPLVPLLWFLLFWGVVFFLVRRVWWRGGWAARAHGPSAEETLGQRYAEGAIEEQEYRARLAVLRSTAEPGDRRR